MLKKIILALFLVCALFVVAPSSVDARSIRVRGYTTKRGTYVNSYHRTSPNRYRYDNYSAKGNYNIYTGKRGTVNWW